ncbi:MAG: hypothetical protein GY696_03665 [Gammaproteobacteria bacterium]|nr:hypothetical protein [Gammaproteobacteria bacterium]
MISRKLALSRPEKKVNNFVADSKLVTRVRHAAASVLQETWFIHKHKSISGIGSSLKVREHQRKFLQAICK